MTVKILIADGRSSLAESVSDMLNTEANFEAFTADSFQGLLREISSTQNINVIIISLDVPGMVGLHSIRSILDIAGDVKVLILITEVDRNFARAAIEAGCRGLVPKTMGLKPLISVINLILCGHLFAPIELTQSSTAAEKVTHNLNNRELAVLRLAANGLTNKEIALSTKKSENIVKMHMRQICKKLGARNRAHAAVISRQRSII